MSDKSRDIYGNWRNILIGVRVSETLYNQIGKLSELEEKDKRTFIREKLKTSRIRCLKNKKAYDDLKPHYDKVNDKMLILMEREHKLNERIDQ